jgi:hypothetical protein
MPDWFSFFFDPLSRSIDRYSGSVQQLISLILVPLPLITTTPAYSQSSTEPTLSASIAGQDSPALGVWWVDLKLTNTSTVTAAAITVASLQLRTLSGTGTVTYAPGLSPALPVLVGNLQAGNSTTVRLYFNVPTTVSPFGQNTHAARP